MTRRDLVTGPVAPIAPTAAELLLASRYAPGAVLWEDRSARTTVISATDTWLGDSVAVAVLGPTADEDATAAFTARARSWSRFYQPGIMELRDLVTWRGAPLAVWDAPPGGTLAGLMSTGVVGAGRVERMVGELAGALDLLAAHGVVHARLHPGAVGFDEDGHARLLPWPAAPAPSGFGGESAWHAPEVLAGNAPDHLSDRWSLGAVGLSALVGTGPGPLDGRQTQGLAGNLRRRTSAPLLSVLTTYMAADPEERQLAPAVTRPAPGLSPLVPAGLGAALSARLRPVAARLAHAASSWVPGRSGLAPDLLGQRRSWGWSGVAGVAVAGAVLSVVPHAVAQPSADGCPTTCSPHQVELGPSPAAGPVAAPTRLQLSAAATATATATTPSTSRTGGPAPAPGGDSGLRPAAGARPAPVAAPHRPPAPVPVASDGPGLPDRAVLPPGGSTHRDGPGDCQSGHTGGSSSDASGSASPTSPHLSDHQG